MKKTARRKKRSGCSPKVPPPETTVPAHAEDLAASLQSHLDQLPLHRMARASGFLRRKPKKLTPALFVQAACLLVTLGKVSYRRWAALIGLLGQCTLTKQALCEHMTEHAVTFLQDETELKRLHRRAVQVRALDEFTRECAAPPA